MDKFNPSTEFEKNSLADMQGTLNQLIPIIRYMIGNQDADLLLLVKTNTT